MLLLLIFMVLMGAVFAAVLNWRVHVVTGEVVSPAVARARSMVTSNCSTLRATAFNPNLWAGGAVIYAKACLLASLTMFISTFASSTIFTIIVAVVVYFIGHLQATARDYWQASSGIAGHGLADQNVPGAGFAGVPGSPIVQSRG